MKILFLQNKGKSYGGIWQVNKIVGEALISDGYDVTVLSIRENHGNYVPEYDNRMHVETLNPIDEWETYNYSDILKDFKSFKIKTGLFKLRHRLHNNKTLKLDAKKLGEYLELLDPDYIINSHYQVLDMIPSKYLSRTFHEHHTDFSDVKKKDNWKTLLRYNNKIKFIWLCKSTMELAKKSGLNNNYYIYNAVRFENNIKNDVTSHKKLITIARICEVKRIDKMVSMANELFRDPKYSDWTLEIYGDGPLKDDIEKMITSKQIKMMGRTTDVEKTFLGASINLNTSDREGFCLTVIEGYECFLPVVSFNYGEPTEEVICNNVTGFIAKDRKEYLEKLKSLMDNPKLLKEMSLNAKEYNKKFHIDKIVKDWEKLFK